MPVTQKRTKKTTAKAARKTTSVKKPSQKKPRAKSRQVSAAKILPQAQTTPSLPSAPIKAALPVARQWPRWAPYFGGLALIALAVTGAMLFGAPKYQDTDSSQGITLGESDAVNPSLETSQLSVWQYAYTWNGNTLDQETSEQSTYSENVRNVTEEDFTAIAQQFGLADTIRSTVFDEDNVSFEAGVVTPSVENSGDTLTPPDATVLSDPNAYQLYAYAQDNRYWYSLLSSADWLSTHQSAVPTADEAKQLAEDYLKSRNLLPADAVGPYVANATENTPFISVYYTQEINGVPVIDQSGELIRYVTIEFGAEAKVINVTGPVIPVLLQESDQKIFAKSASQAWDELQDNKWGPGRDQVAQPNENAQVHTQNIAVQSVEPAYVQVWTPTTDGKRLYEPSYRFIGSIDDADTATSFAYYLVVPMNDDESVAGNAVPTATDLPLDVQPY
ncbi:MAG: hypothetical protein H6760_02805 [Candidatus Nomurabacteria bacterium]|nr:MAG: hypothetical protein H6760_02805 [Candidatus Nomurabacteria bacterium]